MSAILWVKIEIYVIIRGEWPKEKTIVIEEGTRKNNATRVLSDQELQGNITLTRYNLEYFSWVLNVVKFDLFLKNHIDA